MGQCDLLGVVTGLALFFWGNLAQNTGFTFFQVCIESLHQSYQMDILVIPIIQIRKLRCRGVQYPAQSLTTSSWDLDSGSPASD